MSVENIILKMRRKDIFFSIENYVSEKAKQLCKEKTYAQCEINPTSVLQCIVSNVVKVSKEIFVPILLHAPNTLQNRFYMGLMQSSKSWDSDCANSFFAGNFYAEFFHISLQLLHRKEAYVLAHNIFIYCYIHTLCKPINERYH